MHNISDLWDNQIAAVAVGVKRLSVTDYGKEEDLNEYYERFSLDRKLKENVLQYGVIVIKEKEDHGLIGFREENRKYPELLKAIDEENIIVPDDIEAVTYSILLGYNDASTVLNRLSQQYYPREYR